MSASRLYSASGVLGQGYELDATHLLFLVEPALQVVLAPLAALF